MRLAELHSEAVDYAKNGKIPVVDPKLMAEKWPDFMEKKDIEFNYESKTVLGKLYR